MKDVLFLLDTSEAQWEVASTELGGAEVAQLLTPLTRYANRGGKFAIDNGAYAGFDANGFRSLLRRETPNRERCLFVTVPDVVGSGRRTLESFRHWLPQLEAAWPLALVAQDGIEDLEIPWSRIAAIFIGGTTKFKCSQAARQVCAAAMTMEKWVHVGRINTPERLELFDGLVDSVDGTGIARYSWMRRRFVEHSRQLQFDTEA